MQEACALERTRPGRRALQWFANPTSREAKCVFLARPAAELRGTECRATRVGPCDGLAHGTEHTAQARAAVAAKVRAEVRTGGHHFVSVEIGATMSRTPRPAVHDHSHVGRTDFFLGFSGVCGSVCRVRTTLPHKALVTGEGGEGSEGHISIRILPKNFENGVG